MDPRGFTDRKGSTRDDLDVERGTELRGGGRFSIALPDRRPDALLLELEQPCRLVTNGDELHSTGEEVPVAVLNVRCKLHQAKCAESRRKDGPGNCNLPGHLLRPTI
jgi:hypothetical protein